LGLASTVLLVAILRQLSWALLIETLHSAVAMTSMIVTIVVSAAVLSASLAYMHLPQQLAGVIGSLDMSPYALLFLLAVFYIFIGLFMEGVSIFVTTLPIVFPLIIQAGFDPVWFGVFLVIMVELGTVSPPVGFNLYILQGLTGQTMSQVSWAALPFALLLALSGLLLTIFPAIALWLPGVLFDR
jgi:TRAP-type C4-dicarboxylate transport system permease large subunit